MKLFFHKVIFFLLLLGGLHNCPDSVTAGYL